MTGIFNKVTQLLLETTAELYAFLDQVLPTVHGENWWQQAVISALSDSQYRIVKQNGIRSLQELDLAALLRIVDGNWHYLAGDGGFSFQERNYLKEMHSVRNRWAHVSVAGYNDEDVYRDLDTVQRFLQSFNANVELVESVRQIKRQVLTQGLDTVTDAAPFASELEGEALTSATATIEPRADATEFSVGEIVCLLADPTRQGAVVEVVQAQPENRYGVFIDGRKQTFYASQLQSLTQPRESLTILPLSTFHACLSALQIRHPSLSSLYSLNAARIDFIPYQFRPVLKFLHSDRPRLLIADSVGVGKTIEAGLILRELQARRELNSVLIICPRPLVTERKWEREMKRFDERFTHLDGPMLRYCLDEMDLEGEWPDQHKKAILPYSLLDQTLLFGGGTRRAQRGLLELDPSPRFDLVIVDEAHHIRNPDTYRHQGVRFLCEHAEAVVFLTATPIQLGSDDLFVLLSVLRPDLIIDRESFEHMAAPNAYINRAIEVARTARHGWCQEAQALLDEASKTPWGQSILRNSPSFKLVHEKLKSDDLIPKERVRLINEMEDLHTFSGIINRTRRRDIGDFTVRKPETVEVEFSPAQRELHDALLVTQARIFARLHDNHNVMFMLSTIRRQAASCIYGLAPLIEGILTRHLDNLMWDEIDDLREMPNTDAVESIQDEILRVMEMAEKLDPYDPKLEALKRILHDKQAMPNNRVMLFSSFRHTLTYLYENLLKDGFRVGLVHGGTPDDERVALRDRFRLNRDEPHALDVLLFSEVGCEGLDYQFCDCIVNYDLPWNPMRIEQRIGRIDRNGQQSETVAIYNLITPGTVDAEVYERCLRRIGVFEHAIGGNEEILGEIGREIQNIAENFDLTDAERKAKLQQLADNQIRELQEQERLEEQQAELFGIRLPIDRFQEKIDEATNFWLEAPAIQNLIEAYLQKCAGKTQEFILGEKPTKTLRLAQELRHRLLKDFQQLPRETTPVYREWEQWLKGSEPLLSITFDQDAATEDRNLVFLTPVHPLVRQAAYSMDISAQTMNGGSQRIATTVRVADDVIEPGIYPFAVYAWRYLGMREELLLRPAATVPALSERLIELLIHSQPTDIDPTQYLTTEAIEQLESVQYTLWVDGRDKHKEWTRTQVAYRHQSLESSHSARMNLLNEQLQQATDQNIRRMRQSQIANAEADYERRVQELEQSVQKADVTTQLIALGIVKIEAGASHAK